MNNPDSDWMGAFERYQEVMLEALAAWINPLVGKDHERTAQNVDRILFGIKPTQELPPKTLRRDEMVLAKLFYGMAQIVDAIEMLRDAEIYLGRFPHRGKIAPHRFLRYHITNYFNAAYILHARLEQYATTVARIHRNSTHLPHIDVRITSLKAKVRSAMNSLIEARGSYIHKEHFDDDYLARVSTTELLSRRTDSELSRAMAALHTASFREARREWATKLNTHNEFLLKLTAAYFHNLHGIVFDKEGRVIFPTPVRKA